MSGHAPSNTCCARVRRGWQYFPCEKKSKVEVDGKHYCGIHNPIKRAAKRAESEARWDVEWKERQRVFRLNSAAPEMLEALIAVVRVADRATVEFDLARAAIAKATGESA